MKRLYILPFLLLITSLMFYSCSNDDDLTAPEDLDQGDSPDTETDLKFPDKEMRAVWMATAYELDWPQGNYDKTSQKELYITYLKKFKELNINTIFFQVKGMGDAFYDSSYEPWSEYITSTRGEDPGYDILQFLINEAHDRDMEFHAWMNPYRIATRADSSTPFPDLHSSVEPDWVIDLEKIQIYNPALPEVKQRLTDIVEELISMYDVDGIHFDDYFYPADEELADEDNYEEYGEKYSTIENFRRGNVDEAIKSVFDIITGNKPELVFSISPASNGEYNYNSLFADVTKWTSEGWIDLIIPQLYQSIGNQQNDFQSSLNYWSQNNYEAKLMIGHGYHKFGDPSMSEAFQTSDELENQFDLTRKNDKVSGNALYSAQYIISNKVGVTDKLASLYNEPAVIPFIGRPVAPSPVTPENVKIEENKLIWDHSGDVRSVIYYFADKDEKGKVLEISDQNSLSVSEPGYYGITTLNEDNKESEPTELVELK